MTLVWYAAYGSNMSRERFMLYIEGGQPDGSVHHYPGCRDATPPREMRASETRAELLFAGRSKSWQGHGVAFARLGGDAIAKTRLYLIAEEQFRDVVAQENHLDPGCEELNELRAGISYELDRGWYDRVVPAGELDSRPVMTITSSNPPPLSAPSVDYLRHIVRGLRAAHSMSDDEIVDYLAGKRGIVGAVSREELVAVLGDP